MKPTVRLINGDCLEVLPTLADGSVQTVVTSPPYYGLRDYGVDGQIGLESTPDEYVAKMVNVFREVRRVLRDDGTLWLNLGDSYGSGNSGQTCRDSSGGVGSGKVRNTFDQPSSRANCGRMPIRGMHKQLLGIPWRVAFALQADGWILRSEIIWHKPNPMPESVTDRPTKAHEQVFLLAKQGRYFYDADAVREPHQNAEREKNRPSRRANMAKAVADGYSTYHIADHQPSMDRPMAGHPNGRNLRTVWTITPKPFSGAHFATFPPELAERCIKAGSKPGDVVLDPFAGAGTAGLVSRRLGRHFVGVELNPEYRQMAMDRIMSDPACAAPLLDAIEA